MSDDGSRHSQLTHISTLWNLVRDAHSADAAAARSSQAQLIERYAPALHRYLLGILGDAHAADDVLQEFAVRLLRGGFAGADPRRGRFRDYLKTAVTHLAADYRRAQARQTRERPLGTIDDRPASTHAEDAEELFLHAWRQELLNRAWEALAEHEQRSAQPLFHVLKLRSVHPGADSAQLAALLGDQLHPAAPFTAAHVRKLLQRARQRFADLLVEEAARSLGGASGDALEQELIALALHDHCRSALRRRAASTSPSRSPRR